MDCFGSIERDFKEGMASIYAIERLEKLGYYSSKEAEAIVEKWEDEIKDGRTRL